VTVSNAGPQSPTFPDFDANELAAGTVISTPNSYLTVPALNLTGNTNVTFLAWINPNGAQGAYAGLLFNRGGPDSACGFGFGATSDHLGYTWNNNAAATYNWDSTLVVADGEWNFVAYVITPTNATVYLGNLSGGTTNFLQAANPIAHTAETFAGGTIRLGGDANNVSRNFNGLITEATLFTNALTTLQIQQYFLAAIGASSLKPTVPATTIAPSTASVYSGQNVRMSANASGTEPLSYQWQSSTDGSTWANVAAATANTLLISPFTVGTLYYQLVVTNVAGYVTNSSVAVTFNPLPSYPAGLWTANFQTTNNIAAGQNIGAGVGHYVGRGILGNGVYWNILPQVLPSGGGYNATSITSVSDLLDDGATHTGIYCHMNNGGGYNSLGGSLTYSSDIGNLLDQFYRTYYSDAANGNGALQFFGVPAGTYNLVCYAGNGVTSNGANNYGSTFVVYDSVNGNQTNSTAEPTPVTTALSEGVNFVTFTNVHIAGGVLNVEVLGNTDMGGSAIIEGAQLQLVSLSPTTVTLSNVYNPTNKTLTLSWPQGILQTTTNLATGPWTPIYAPSPLTVTATNTMQFYRLQIP
jgi:Concanavalin A-like lectin/glucanases superfamily